LSLRSSVSSLWVLCLSLWACLPLTAAAEDVPDVHLTWERPLGSTCPPANVLERDVEETLDRRVFTTPANARLVIRGLIEENDSGGTWVRLTARHSGGTVLGTRELRATGGGCAALRSDIVLVLTLLVDERISSDAGSAVRVDFGASATALLQVLPRWSAGVGPTLVVDIDSVQLRADLAYFMPVIVRTRSGIQASLRAASLSLRACQRLFAAESSPFTLHVCAGIQAGAWLISQNAPETRALQLRLLAQGLLDLRAGLRLADSVKLELGAGPSFSLSRTSLYAFYEDDMRVLLYRVPFLGAQLQLGLVF
jgi:hypothetical protein